MKIQMKIQVYILIILTLFLQFSFVLTQSDIYNFVTVSKEYQNRGAACLDGSPPGYYVNQGFGQNKNNFIIYFNGGGFCGESTLAITIESCYNRSFTNLGSSVNQSPTINAIGMGILSSSKEQNPYFYDWTKFKVIYCDGTEYLGYRQNPISYKDRLIYFRGSRNIKQTFSHMNEKYGIFNGGSIIISGTSAGGMATFQWSNYLQQKSTKAKVFALPDSGFFITDYFSPLVNKKLLREHAEPLFNLAINDHKQLPQPILNCMQQPDYDAIDCCNAANYAKYLKIPIFMIQSPYDQWSLDYIVDIQCKANKKAPYSLSSCNDTVRTVIEDYRLKSIQYLKTIKGNRTDIGVWGPACVQHGYIHVAAYSSSNYQVGGVTLRQALERFIKQPNKADWLLDEITWPNNRGCSGLDPSIKNLQFE